MKRIALSNMLTNEVDVINVAPDTPEVDIIHWIKKMYRAEIVHNDGLFYHYTPIPAKPLAMRKKTYEELEAENTSFRKELTKIVNLQGNENNPDEGRIIAREAKSIAKYALADWPEVKYE